VTPISLGPTGTSPAVDAGEHVRVTPEPPPRGAPASARQPAYDFAGFDRRTPLLWLAAICAVLAIALIRWRGVLALVGVAASLVLVTQFLVPALVQDTSPTLTALVGSLAVMFITVLLTDGIGAQTLAATLGIAISLLIATGLAAMFVNWAHLDGYSSDLTTAFYSQGRTLSLQALVLAGMVIGVLGVLADMAVSQASSVMALRRANPGLRAPALYRHAFVIGRDHLSATIHTLVLAYIGAALPLLLIVQGSGVNLTDTLNAQDLAEPIVATLVGSIALIAGVPLITGLAALLISRMPPDALTDAHAHAH
jgi:uncharacterized membrane protein